MIGDIVTMEDFIDRERCVTVPVVVFFLSLDDGLDGEEITRLVTIVRINEESRDE